MKLNQAGLSLIKKYEGFRSRAYRDAVGVWTIGYGHTSMAGTPRVTSTLKISRQQAEKILARDVEHFSRRIRPLILVDLNDNQFSALLSFAYNVGVGAFKKSSVLRRVSAGRFDAVPARLSLWVKAGGRTLTGLVRRRASEGELFLVDSRANPQATAEPVGPIPGKPAHKSSTNIAAVFSAISGLVSVFFSGVGQHTSGVLIVLSALVIIAATLWIVRERWIKSQSEGV